MSDKKAILVIQGILDPDHVADAYWQLHDQPRDAWTHETELRRWIESW